jgi:hypothetical protein
MRDTRRLEERINSCQVRFTDQISERDQLPKHQRVSPERSLITFEDGGSRGWRVCRTDHRWSEIVEIKEKCPATEGYTIILSCLERSICKVVIGAQPLLVQ